MRAWAASSGGTRNIDRVQDGAVGSEFARDTQEFSRASILAVQVAVDSGQGCWLADAVPQSHEVNGGAGGVVDPDGLAWGGFHVGQAEFKGRRPGPFLL